MITVIFTQMMLIISIVFSNKNTNNTIPVIDLRPFIYGNHLSKKEVVSQIKYALESTGFILLKNHGISQNLIDAGFEMQRDFFYQSIEEKQPLQKSFDNSTHRLCGWYRNELLYGNKPDKKETYDLLMNELATGYNPWFKGQQLNDFYDLATSMKTTSQYLFNALSLALGGSEEFLSTAHDNLDNTYMRFVYYNQDNADDGLLLQPHTDFMSLTMGFQDEFGGLEVWDKSNKQWIELPYIEGTMIVNIGDAIQRWSNDRFLSNFHRLKRVKNTINNERLSFYLFVGPAFEQMIDGKDFGVDEDDLLYEPATFGEYFLERIAKTYEVEERDDHTMGDVDAVFYD